MHYAPPKHTVIVSGVPFEVDTCYMPYKLIGKGAYGLVCAARVDPAAVHVEDREVAIKKIPGIFSADANIIEAKRTLREIHLLRHMRHENVLSVRDVLVPSDVHSPDVYIVFEKMDSDMHRIITSRQHLTDDHTRFFLYQLLRGLKYLHSAGVVHRDLKPSNLLLNANCDLKISDFGLARTLEPDGKLTQYVVTRWYRAPELLLMASTYSTAVDMWSVGCIFAELLNRQTLFQGRTHVHQLQLILAKLGAPSQAARANAPPQVVNAIDTALDPAAAAALGTQVPRGPPLGQCFPGASPEAVDLVKRLLRFDPRERLSAEEALRHPYLQDLHEEEAEPVSDHQFAIDFEADSGEPDWGQLRAAYFEVAADFLARRTELERADSLARPGEGDAHAAPMATPDDAVDAAAAAEAAFEGRQAVGDATAGAKRRRNERRVA